MLGRSAFVVVLIIWPFILLTMMPAWDFLESKLRFSVGLNPCIVVGKAFLRGDGKRVINLKGCDEITSVALKLFMEAEPFGGVVVNVLRPDSTTLFRAQIPSMELIQCRDYLIEKMKVLFSENRYFESITVAGPVIEVGIADVKIKYFCGGLLDSSGMCVYPAVDVFRDLIRTEINGLRVIFYPRLR